MLSIRYLNRQLWANKVMEESSPRLIKRYANRKLYDTDRSRYVTLEQIAEMIRAGEEVKIIDYRSNEDITSTTLAQIVFEKEKKQISAKALRNIIQQGSDAIEQFQKRVTKTVDGVRTEAEKGLDRLEAIITEGLGKRNDVIKQLRGWYRGSQESLGDIQRRVEEQLDRSLVRLAPKGAIGGELKQIHREIKKLQERLLGVDRRLAQEEEPKEDSTEEN